MLFLMIVFGLLAIAFLALIEPYLLVATVIAFHSAPGTVLALVVFFHVLMVAFCILILIKVVKRIARG
jgi:hypothetical protein